MANLFTIDYNNNHQEIDFLGASQATWSSELFNQPEPIYTQVLDLLFTEQGINASVLRCDIAPEYFPESGVYDFNAHFEQTEIMAQAKARGDVKFIATVWSPPAWMKTNNNLVHGHLDPVYYAEYAECLVRYVLWFEEQFDLAIDAISIANEPESTAAVGWISCAWSADELHDFHLNYLKPQWEAYELTGKVKIIVGEPFGWTEEGQRKTLNDSALTDYIDVVAAHNYPIPLTGGGKFPQLPLPIATELGKKMWMTEVSTVGGNDTSMTSGLFYAKEMHTFFTTVNASAYLYWLGACPSRDDEGLLYVVKQEDGTTVCETTKRFYCFGNYSKFVRPDDVRVSALPASSEDIYISAFKNKSGSSLAVVVVNDSELETTIELDVNNSVVSSLTPYLTDESYDLEAQPMVNIDEISGTFTLTLPPRSVSTYVSN